MRGTGCLESRLFLQNQQGFFSFFDRLSIANNLQGVGCCWLYFVEHHKSKRPTVSVYAFSNEFSLFVDYH